MGGCVQACHCAPRCSAGILERTLKRLEWEKVREREIKDAEDEAERERQSYQAVDWCV